MSTNLIPENVYRVKCVRAEFGESMGKGTPYARVTLELREAGEFTGRRVSKDLWFTDKTWQKSIEALRCLGWQGDDITDLRGVDANVAAAKVVQEVVTDKDGNVKTDPEGHAVYRNAVAWIGKDNAPKEMEAGKLAGFRELMRARIQQMGTENGAAGQGAKSDDIPF